MTTTPTNSVKPESSAAEMPAPLLARALTEGGNETTTPRRLLLTEKVGKETETGEKTTPFLCFPGLISKHQ